MTFQRRGVHAVDMRVVYGLGVLVLLLLSGTALISYRNVGTLFDNNRLVVHTHEVVSQLGRVLSNLKDAETGQRGYLLTGRDSYLVPYRDAVGRLPHEIDRLKSMIKDNSFQQERLARLEPKIAAKLSELEASISEYRTENPRAALDIVLSDRGRQQMDDLRRGIAGMEDEELSLLGGQVTESERSLGRTLFILTSAMATTLALLLATGYLLRKSMALQQQAEERLYSEREWLNVTLRSIGDAVMATDNHGRVLFMNQVAEALTGWQQSEAGGQASERVFQIVDEQTRQRSESPVETVLRQGAVLGLSNHTVLLGKDGRERPIDNSAAPIRDQDGNILGVVLVFRDVTQRRRAEELLEQGWRDLDDFFENSPIGLHWMAPDGTVLRVNQAELDMFGYAREEYLGHHLAEFFASPAVLDEMIGRLRSGETIGNIEAQVRCKDGSIKDVLISANGRWENGKFVHSRCFTRDITERKRAENSLRFLVDVGRTLGSLVDYDSTLQKTARLFVPFFADFCLVDLLEGSQMRRMATAHVDPAKEQILRQLRQQYPIDWSAPTVPIHALRTGKPELIPSVSDALLRGLARDESHLASLRALEPRSAMVIPLVIRNRVQGMILLVQSESHRHYSADDLALAEELAQRTAAAVENARLYQELRESDRRKDEFLAMLAHELRNPLAAIQYANFLSRSPNIEQEGIDCSAMIEEQIGQLSRLIDDLLDVSRITRDKVQLKQEVLDVRVVAQRAIGVVRPLVEQREHQLEVDLADDPLWVRADRARLEQMIVNLLANAAKYTEQGGRIRLVAQQEDGKVLIKVRDTGIGIAPEMLSQVFLLFMQVDRSLERSDGGLGIGLTLVRKLAELHGGGVAADSPGLGKGSEFTLWLPTAAQDATPANLDEAPVAAPARPLRILIVEDNVDAAKAVAVLLKNLGHEVRICFDGRPALAEAIDHRPDVVLLDLGLPGIDGYQLAATFRREEKVRHARLIAISGYGQAEDRKRSVDVGFDDHLVKPIDFDTLKSLLAAAGQTV